MSISTSKGRIESLKDGKILIIRPENSPAPLFCPICAFPMKTLDDVVAYRQHQCCNRCELYWSGSNLGSWKDGWRPNSTTLGWDEYIQERKLLARSLITLR